MARLQDLAPVLLVSAVSLIGIPQVYGAVIEVDGVCTLVDAITAAETDTATVCTRPRSRTSHAAAR